MANPAHAEVIDLELDMPPRPSHTTVIDLTNEPDSPTAAARTFALPPLRSSSRNPQPHHTLPLPRLMEPGEGGIGLVPFSRATNDTGRGLRARRRSPPTLRPQHTSTNLPPGYGGVANPIDLTDDSPSPQYQPPAPRADSPDEVTIMGITGPPQPFPANLSVPPSPHEVVWLSHPEIVVDDDVYNAITNTLTSHYNHNTPGHNTPGHRGHAHHYHHHHHYRPGTLGGLPGSLLSLLTRVDPISHRPDVPLPTYTSGDLIIADPPPAAPVSTARPGFTHDTAEENVVVCPNCHEELAYDPDDSGPIISGPHVRNAAAALKRVGSNHFWAVKACGHVYCAQCYDDRRKKNSRFKIISSHKVECAVEGCRTEVQNKTAWVGIYL